MEKPGVRYCTDPIGVCEIPAVCPQVIADAAGRAQRRLGISGQLMTYGINVAGPAPRVRFELGDHALEAATIPGLLEMLELLEAAP